MISLDFWAEQCVTHRASWALPSSRRRSNCRVKKSDSRRTLSTSGDLKRGNDSLLFRLTTDAQDDPDGDFLPEEPNFSTLSSIGSLSCQLNQEAVQFSLLVKWITDQVQKNSGSITISAENADSQVDNPRLCFRLWQWIKLPESDPASNAEL